MAGAPLLAIEGLSVSFRTRRGDVAAVTDATLAIAAGESVGVVGESGSGKTTLAFAVMGYVPPGGRIAAGRIRFQGGDVAAMTGAALERYRGGGVAMVPQEPGAALNPSLAVGRQLVEVPIVHRRAGRAAARDEAMA